MKDGTRLSTYVQFPEGVGPWPVIFSRSPYPGMLEIWKERAKLWAEHGYVFVYQECRGTGGSEGEWVPFIYEKTDGLNSLDWIINQDWMDGNIATYGASYSGVVQWCMAEELPPQVKTMFISVTGIERYRQNYMNGMFRHDIYTLWAVGNSGMESRFPLENTYEEALRVRPHIEMDTHIYGKKLPWYRDWVTNVEEQSPFWSSGLWAEMKEIPRKIEVPIMMVAGWFDHNLDASIQSYKKLPKQVRDESIMIIGPWVHTEDIYGDLDYSNHDQFGQQQFKAALAWFDHHLKGIDCELSKGSVYTYIIREQKWSKWNGWIKGDEFVSYYLTTSDVNKVGTLSTNIIEETIEQSYQYDPEEPVPTNGGSALLAYLSGSPKAAKPGSVPQFEPGWRKDVLSFVSETIDTDMQIVGEIKAFLYVSSDAEDTSFTVTIMEVFPDGTTYNIRDGISSLRYRNNQSYHYRPGDVEKLEIEMWPVTWTIKKGSRIRVDVSSSNFPAYHIHPNYAGPWALQKETKIANQTIYFGGNYNTNIEFPIVKMDGKK